MIFKRYIQIFSVILLLYLLYYLGVSLYYIVLIGLILILFIVLKGKIYHRLEKEMNKKFPSLAKRPLWVKRLIIIVTFLVIYLLIKQIIFLIFKIIGIDIQKIIYDELNKSIIK